MATSNALTTLVCLFHHQDHARDAIHDLREAGVSESSLSIIGDLSSATSAYQQSSLAELGIPERDEQHLAAGVRSGGVIVAVAASSEHVGEVEDIFEEYARKIDEADVETESLAAVAPITAAAALPATGEIALPIVEEELLVGKRTVDHGGVRVYRRLIEVPQQESVQLREEHVVVERRPVNRTVTNADLSVQGDHTIELIETAEEAVISKNARVVEEVLIGKQTTEHTETVHDTVRHTEVDIEQVPTSSTDATRTL